jgi:hypothetical protein
MEALLDKLDMKGGEAQEARVPGVCIENAVSCHRHIHLGAEGHS